MIAQMSVQIILALNLLDLLFFYNSPSAEIGRQDELKLRWLMSWTFKSFLGYMKLILFYFILFYNTDMTRRNASTNLLVIPIVSYTNPDIEKISILKNNDKKTGIYRWTNKATGKFYIGSAQHSTAQHSNQFKKEVSKLL